MCIFQVSEVVLCAFLVSERLYLYMSGKRFVLYILQVSEVAPVYFRLEAVLYILQVREVALCISGEACRWCGGVAGKIARLSGSHTQRTQCWRCQ